METTLMIKEQLDPHIRTLKSSSTQIVYKAAYQESCFEPCDTGASRLYFHVLENGYESNRVVVCTVPLSTLCWCITCIPLCFDVEIPGNVCCRGDDVTKKRYFDRGQFDEGDLYHWLRLVDGPPVVYSGDVPCICCCVEVTDYSCPTVFGETVRVVPCHTCLCCIPNSSTALTNCGGTCGPKTGEPLCMYELASCLRIGEARRVADAVVEARREWASRLDS